MIIATIFWNHCVVLFVEFLEQYPVHDNEFYSILSKTKKTEKGTTELLASLLLHDNAWPYCNNSEIQTEKNCITPQFGLYLVSSDLYIFLCIWK